VRTNSEALAGVLSRGLPTVCLVTGTEPLLIAEACDAIRAKARSEGYADREVHFLERSFDWNELLADAASLSLFATRRLIELKFSSPPDAVAAKALTGLAERPPQDTLLLVSGELEWKRQQAAWVKSYEKAGLLVLPREVGRDALPGWIRERLEQRGVALAPEAAELLADRVEGNLLAAQQEIERIALLMPGATLDTQAVQDLVSDSARYDVFELAATALAGQPARALRVLAGLRAEGREPTLIIWALAQGLRTLSRAERWRSEGRAVEAMFNAERTWFSLRRPVAVAVNRLSRDRIDHLMRAAARADLVTKGSLRGDPWVELAGLVAGISGIRLAA
jgi:DNA polymerase-3 subunit delta